MRDLTERRRAEETIRDSQSELAEAQRMARIGSWRWDIRTGEVTWSDEHWAILALEPGEVLKIDIEFFDSFVHPDDLKVVRDARRHTLKTAAPYDANFRIIRRNGEMRYVHARSKRGADDGHVMIGTLQDVTERFQAEKALRETEARLSDAIESISEGFILYDTNERFVLCNSGYREFYPQIDDMLVPGTKLEDILRAAVERGAVVGSSENAEATLRRILEHYRTARGAFHEQQIADGRWLMCSENRMRHGGIVGVRADITERKGAEKALRVSEHKFRNLFENAAAGIGRSRKSDGKVLLANRKLAQIFGYERVEQFIAEFKFADHYVDPDERERLIALYQNDLQTTVEVSFTARDASVITVANQGWTEERADYIDFVMIDITERKRAEKALRTSESMFERAFESSPSLSSIVSIEDRRMLRVNDAWCRTLGYNREDVIGKFTDDLDVWPDDDAKKRLRGEFALNGFVRAFPIELRSARGDAVYVDTYADVLEFEGGKAIFTVSHDRTERKRYEDAVWAAKENAELANRTKSEFLANVSHELRTPLNAILGFSEMMEMGLAGPLTEKQTEYLADIHRSGEHLLGLINDVIDLSTIELGKMKLALESVDLAVCIEECAAQMKYKMAEAGLSLRVGELSVLPSVTGDRRRIKQVLLNLLSNAAKFTDPDGEITIEGTVTAARECGINIADTGVGMTPTLVQQALTAFSRGDDPMVRNKEGAGLGLSLVQSLVKAHGGRVAIESTWGLEPKSP
jgi:PAS domain S-box-containing protein